MAYDGDGVNLDAELRNDAIISMYQDLRYKHFFRIPVLGIKGRTWRDLKNYEWLLIAITALSLLARFILTIWKLAILPKTSNDFSFTLVLLLSTIFCLWYLSEGVLIEAPYELFVLSISTVLAGLYVILNYVLGVQDSIILVRLVITSVLSPPIIGLGIWIAMKYWHSGRLIFRTKGANQETQQMCWTLVGYRAMFKFDLQLSLSMVIFILTTGEVLDVEELVIIIVGTLIVLGCALIGIFGVHLEKKSLSIIYACTLIIQPVYVVFKIEESARKMSPDTDNLALPTIVCGAVALAVRCALVYFFIKSWKNFGKGLLERTLSSDNSNSYGTIQ